MTRLLVSVRDVNEAQTAYRCGVDIIDLKEPAGGSLGCVDLAICEEIITQLPNDQVLSLAMGELQAYSLQEFANWPLARFQFAKLGLAGMQQRAAWQSRWRAWRHSLPLGCTPVAVAYVDAASGAPDIATILHEAAEQGIPVLLLDTFTKSSSLFEHLSWQQLTALRTMADKLSITLVIAGGLQLETIRRLATHRFTVVAVRGAACIHGRTSPVSTEKILDLQAAANPPMVRV